MALVVGVVLTFSGIGGAATYLLFFKSAESEPLAREPDSASGLPLSGSRDADAGARSATVPSERPLDEDEGSAAGGVDGDASIAAPLKATASSTQRLLHRHYQLIDSGDYASAWRLFHPEYRNGVGANWVDQKNKGLPRIDLDSLQIDYAGRLSSDMVRLDVELVAADTRGDEAGICRRFVGWARVQRVGNEWLYRPGEVDGQKPGLKEQSISESDPRCRRVLD